MNKFDITKGIGYSILNVARHMSSHMDNLNGDVTMAQAAVLYFLAKSDADCMIQQDLAEIMNLNKSGLLRTVDILEKKGMLKRMPVKNDRRKNKIELTRHGFEEVDKFVNKIEQKERELRSGFTKQEVDSFFRVLTQLMKKVGKEDHQE